VQLWFSTRQTIYYESEPINRHAYLTWQVQVGRIGKNEKNAQNKTVENVHFESVQYVQRRD